MRAAFIPHSKKFFCLHFLNKVLSNFTWSFTHYRAQYQFWYYDTCNKLNRSFCRDFPRNKLDHFTLIHLQEIKWISRLLCVVYTINLKAKKIWSEIALKEKLNCISIYHLPSFALLFSIHTRLNFAKILGWVGGEKVGGLQALPPALQFPRAGC